MLWRFTPPGYSSWAGSAQITTATPVADPGRTAIYAASPDGKIYKLAIADGHPLWSATITKLPGAREDRRLAQLRERARDRDDRRLHRRRPALSGARCAARSRERQGPARSGTRSAATAMRSSSHRAVPRATRRSGGAQAPSSIPATGDLLVATGNAPWDGRTNWGDAVLVLNPARDEADRQLHADEHGRPQRRRRRPRLDVAGRSRPGLRRAGRQGRDHPPAEPQAPAGRRAAQGWRAADRPHAVGHRPLHRPGRLALDVDVDVRRRQRRHGGIRLQERPASDGLAQRDRAARARSSPAVSSGCTRRAVG